MSAVTVVPVLPCDGCAHLAVCSIRPLLAPLDEWAANPVLVPPHEAIRLTIDVRVDCGHFLDGGTQAAPSAAVADHASEYSSPIPEPAAAATQTVKPPPGATPVAGRRLAKPLGPPMAVCDPGCGNMFTEGLLGAHRRECESYAASRAGKVRDVGHRDGPAPLSPASVEAIETAEAENERFAQRRQDAAREAADRTWAERHDGIERPLPAERAQPGTTGLTANQERVVDAIRACGGDQAEAARRLGLEGTPARLYSAVQKLRKTGRLPADVAELLDRRKAAKGRAS